MPTKKPDQWLTPREVAEQLGLSYLKVLELIAADEFPHAINVASEGNGARYKVPQADVTRWPETRKVSAA